MTMRATLVQSGFSLIELMIAIVIFAFLVLLAGPMYTTYIGNTQIRAAGEALLNGVRLAHAEAVKRNAAVRFVLNASSGWTLYAADPSSGADGPVPGLTYSFSEGASKATVTPSAGTVTFDGLGRIIPNTDASASLTEIDITNTNISDPRPLSVVISAIGGTQGGTKLCDPHLSSPDPAAC